MLPWPCVWREAEGRLRKAFSFHSHPPKRFCHLIHFIGFYSSSHSIHMWRRAGLYEARPGGPACRLVHVWSQQKPVKRSSGGFCLKRGFSQPDLFIAWLQKHLCQQKAGGVMGVERGGWRAGEESLPVSLPAQSIIPAEEVCFGCRSSTAACCFLVCLCCLIDRVQMGLLCPEEGSKITSRTASKVASPLMPTGDLWVISAARFAGTQLLLPASP